MPKGRPPLEPRIAALEKQLADALQRIIALETHRSIPTLTDAYRPNFDHWPNASQR